MRDTDFILLERVLDPRHAPELGDGEREAFARMLAELQSGERHVLSRKQRAWVEETWARIKPLPSVASGAVARGIPSRESRALDAMLAAPKPLRPPRHIP